MQEEGEVVVIAHQKEQQQKQNQSQEALKHFAQSDP
jgi:hypothetical protein